MELSVINSIIFGALQPWQVVNQNEQRLYDLLRTSTTILPLTIGELNKTNKILLRDHPDLYKDITGNQDKTLPAPFFETTSPKPFNSITEFYSLLIQCAALQFVYELTTTIQQATHEDETYYFTNRALEKVKYIAAGAASELQRQELNHIPDYRLQPKISTEETIKQNTHFILYLAKQTTTTIFFEIQERFKLHVRSLETEEQFFTYTLKEPAPEQSFLNPTPAYYTWKVGQLISDDDFDLEKVIALLNHINSLLPTNTQLKPIQIALENIIFSHQYGMNKEGTSFTDLIKPETNNNLFIEAKENIEAAINKLDRGYKRHELITEELNKFITSPELDSQSAISKLYKWLLQQQTLFSQLLTEKFSVEPEISKPSKPKPATKLSFGFTNRKEKLNLIIVELCNKVELLNEDHTSSAELINLLISKNIKPASARIFLGCETTQFAYIVIKLSDYFTNLNPKTIEASKCFYSKRKSLINAQNLYSSAIENPKNKELIDNIFK